MDNFLLHAITQELAALLIGRQLGKVYQLGVTDLACDFQLRDGRWLMASTDPQRLALYLSARPVRQREVEARHDTAFPALVKKYLSGARVESIEKLGYDRVVRFDCAVREESGETTHRSLVFSLIGRSANVFLLEGAQILAALRETTLEDYQEPAPPADKLDPFQLSPELLDTLLAQHAGDLVSTAYQHLLGFTALYAEELARRAATQSPYAALTGLLEELFERPPQPTLYTSAPLEEMKRDLGCAEFVLTLSPIALLKAPAPFVQSYPTVHQAADVRFTLLDDRRNFLALRQQLQSQLSAKLKKQQTLLQNLTRERDGFSRGETQQRYGELLLANLQQAEKTATGFRVTDFYDAELPHIEIPAANQPTPQAAAEHYFKLARKARHGLQSLNARLPQVAAEITESEQRLAQLVTISQRAAKPAGQSNAPARPKPKTKEEKISGVRRYRSSDGYEMLVGRTDRDNDALTFRVAKSYDLWFHVADYPGSHVVLRNPQRQPVPPRTITEAAQLAAQFSHARRDARVAVNYCERKFVSKQKGAPPGQVRLSSFKTMLVEPREAGERLLD
jgi:predicted ribosome quality control (RQC) complex YloA/Tae2 family protein